MRTQTNKAKRGRQACTLHSHARQAWILWQTREPPRFLKVARCTCALTQSAIKPTKIGTHDDAKLSLDSRSRQAQPSTVSRTYRDARNAQVFVGWLYAAHKDERMRKQTDKAERWRQAWILHSHAREAWISWERVNRTRPPKSCAVPLPAPLPSDSLPSKPGNMAAQNNANFPGPSLYPQIGVYGPNMSKIRGI